MKAAGTCGPAPGVGTAAASSWSRIIVRTLAGVTPSSCGGLVPVEPLVDEGGQVGLGEDVMRPCWHPCVRRRTRATPRLGRGASEMPVRATRPYDGADRILPRPGAGGSTCSQTGTRPAPTAGERPAGSTDPLTGRLLDGRYRIGPRIARGGMASVYEATDLRLDRTVAVKVMHPGLGDDDEFAARFVREARAAARLSPPQRRRGLRPGRRRRHGLPGHGAGPRPHAARRDPQGGADVRRPGRWR